MTQTTLLGKRVRLDDEVYEVVALDYDSSLGIFVMILWRISDNVLFRYDVGRDSRLKLGSN